MTFEVRAAEDDADWDGYAVAMAQSFGQPLSVTREWVTRDRRDAIGVIAVDRGRVVGGTQGRPLGQYFGGQAVRAGCVVGFVVVPEARRQGVAAAMLRRLGAAMLADGCVVSPLWPATTRLYRRWGWEVVARHARHQVATRSLAALSGVGEVEREPDREAARTLVASVSPLFDGPLEPAPFRWRLAYPDPLPEGRFAYGWRESGRLTGLVIFRQQESQHGFDLMVEEFWCATGEARRGLLGFLSSSDSQSPRVRLSVTAQPFDHDLLWLLPEQDARTEGWLGWMFRLLDPAAALVARGWSPGAVGTVGLEVHDPWSETPVRMTVAWEGGRAVVTPVGSGQVKGGIGAFSAWYAGGLTARRAAALGLLEGPEAALAVMDTSFDHRPVWLPQQF